MRDSIIWTAYTEQVAPQGAEDDTTPLTMYAAWYEKTPNGLMGTGTSIKAAINDLASRTPFPRWKLS